MVYTIYLVGKSPEFFGNTNPELSQTKPAGPPLPNPEAGQYNPDGADLGKNTIRYAQLSEEGKKVSLEDLTRLAILAREGRERYGEIAINPKIEEFECKAKDNHDLDELISVAKQVVWIDNLLSLRASDIAAIAEIMIAEAIVAKESPISRFRGIFQKREKVLKSKLEKLIYHSDRDGVIKESEVIKGGGIAEEVLLGQNGNYSQERVSF